MNLHDHVIARDDRIRALLEREAIPLDGVTWLALLMILHTCIAQGILAGEQAKALLKDFEEKGKGGVN